MSGLARREGLAVMQPNFFLCLKRGFTPSPPLPSHQRMEAYGERRTNTICNALIFLLPKKLPAEVVSKHEILITFFLTILYRRFVTTGKCSRIRKQPLNSATERC